MNLKPMKTLTILGALCGLLTYWVSGTHLGLLLFGF